MRWLFVIARNSAFAFRGRAMEVGQIAQQLGVRYILTGSVRRSGKRARISVQLVEANTASSLWAERYDHDLEDILALQDDIASKVAGAIEPELLKKRANEPPAGLTRTIRFGICCGVERGSSTRSDLRAIGSHAIYFFR